MANVNLFIARRSPQSTSVPKHTSARNKHCGQRTVEKALEMLEYALAIGVLRDQNICVQKGGSFLGKLTADAMA